MSERVMEYSIYHRGRLASPASTTLESAIAAWMASPEAQEDPFKTRQLLAQLSIQCVQGFRAEEDRLARARAPELLQCQRENHRLALRLRDLMAAAERGLEVGAGLRALIEIRCGRLTQATLRRPSSALEH